MRPIIVGAFLVSLTFGAVQADEFERLPLKESAKAIPYLAPLSLEASRTLCVTGEHQQKGVDDMLVHDYCRSILDETAKRYRASGDEALVVETYKRWSWDYPYEIIKGVAKASLKDETQFIGIRDKDKQRIWMPLSCGLAYDVGYFYGVKNPDNGIGYGQTMSLSDGQRETCFASNASSRKTGFMVGIQDGRAMIKRAHAAPAVQQAGQN